MVSLKTVTIFTGMDVENGKKVLNGDFNTVSWWSDNYETLAHYYEGCAIEIKVQLIPQLEQNYIREVGDLNVPISEYTYGFAEMECPKDAIWYSFGAQYLKNNVLDIREIFPDLSMYNE